METYMFEYRSKEGFVRRRIGETKEGVFYRKEFQASDDNEALKIVEEEKEKGRRPIRLLRVIKTNW